MMKDLFQIIFFLISVNMGMAQVPPKISIPELPNTFISDVCNLPDGGFAAVTTLDYPDFMSSGLLMVFSSSGDLERAVAVQDSQLFSRFKGIEYNSQNHTIYVAGDYTRPDRNIVFLLAFDTTGIIQYQAHLTGNFLLLRNSHFSKDGIVLTTDVNLPGSTDVGVFFMDYQGRLIWQTQLSAPGYDYPNSIWASEELNQILVVSTSQSQSLDDEEEITISKLDHNGKLISAVYIEHPGQQGDPTIFSLEDSTIIITARDDFNNVGWNVGLQHDLSLRFANSLGRTETDYGYPKPGSNFSLVSVSGLVTDWSSGGQLQDATFLDFTISIRAVEYTPSINQLVLGGTTSATSHPYFIIGRGDPLTTCTDITQDVNFDSIMLTIKPYPWDTLSPNVEVSTDPIFIFRLLNLDVENQCEAILQTRSQSVEGIDLFPNPTYGKLTLRMNNWDNPLFVQIISLQGSILKEIHLDSNGQFLDVDNLTPGTYLLKAFTQSNEQFYVQKFIKY